MLSKTAYFKNKLDHHRQAAAHHADMAEQGIHVDYHKQQEARHLEAIDKLERKGKNKAKSQDKREGASVTGGSLSPVQSGISTAGTPGGNMSTP